MKRLKYNRKDENLITTTQLVGLKNIYSAEIDETKNIGRILKHSETDKIIETFYGNLTSIKQQIRKSLKALGVVLEDEVRPGRILNAKSE